MRDHRSCPSQPWGPLRSLDSGPSQPRSRRPISRATWAVDAQSHPPTGRGRLAGDPSGGPGRSQEVAGTRRGSCPQGLWTSVPRGQRTLRPLGTECPGPAASLTPAGPFQRGQGLAGPGKATRVRLRATADGSPSYLSPTYAGRRPYSAGQLSLLTTGRFSHSVTQSCMGSLHSVE